MLNLTILFRKLMLYLFKLKLNLQNDVRKKDFYYSILGFVLNLFENDQIIYQNMIRISFDIVKGGMNIYISIFGSENFKKALNILLNNIGKQYSVDKHIFIIEAIDLNFSIFDIKLILNDYELIKSFEIKFLSPTMIRNRNFIFVLPESDRFLYSVLNKLLEISDYKIVLNNLFQGLEQTKFKSWLRQFVIPSKFNLNTKIVNIKGNIRAGVVGDIKYNIFDLSNENYNKLLYILLRAANFTGIGSGTKLGLGNVKVLF